MAARLSRADLATALVTEMTGLAGTMGRHYALRAGVAPAVAEASHTLHTETQTLNHIPAAPTLAWAPALSEQLEPAALVKPTLNAYPKRTSCHGEVQPERSICRQ